MPNSINKIVKISKKTKNDLEKTHHFSCFQTDESWFMPSNLNIPANSNIIILVLGEVKEEGTTMTNEQLYAKLSADFDQKINVALKPIKEDIAELKQDVSILKQDVSELKQDVKILKREALTHGWDLTPDIEENNVQSEQEGQEESNDSLSQNNTEESKDSNN